jgi:uncharacterized membrane protein YeaQ/YmgE (transglycosylase-associated protein family)
MGIIVWLIFGALAGWIASKLVGTDSQQGWIMNIVMGIVGAIVGGFLWGLISDGEFKTGFNVGSLIIAVVGAIIVTFAVSTLTGKKI